MRTMVVDAGGRGQALGAKLYGEGHEVIMSPGNPGNEDFAYSTGITPTDIEGQLAYARDNQVEFTVVGADDPLAMGIVDRFQDAGQEIFGPTAKQARIESDRILGKRIGEKLGIPMPEYLFFPNPAEAIMHASKITQWPVFVKDNELAQGKGATRCENAEEYIFTVGELGRSVVETFVSGPEASLHSFCDGKIALPIPLLVRDHKQVGEGGTGPMTGGMGTAGPLPEYGPEEVEALNGLFAQPIAKRWGFKGLLFTGLKGEKGQEVALEWNARFGDPETQSYLKLMKSELLPVLQACSHGELDSLKPLEWHLGKSIITLVLASPGYPEKARIGKVIEGLETAANRYPNAQIIHAATAWQGADLVTAGGRTLNVVVMGDSMEEARRDAYGVADLLGFDGEAPLKRGDIGLSLV